MMRQVRAATLGQQQMAQASVPRLPVRATRSSLVCKKSRAGVATTSVSTETAVYTNGNGNSAAAAATVAANTAAPQFVVPQIVLPEQVPGMLPPPKIFEAAVATGVAKAESPFMKILVKGILAGAYISVGAAVLLTVGGNCAGMAADNPGLQRMLMGIFGLPTFLTMTIVTGAELFTGNTALVTMAVLEGKANWGQLIKSWCVSYLGNMIGCAAVVALLFHSGIFATATAPITVATYKATLPLGQAILRSIGCNWLVCMAVWQATGATSFPGKFLSCLLPISAFVALGLEHSIANMFIIPMGILLGAPVTFGDFLMNNLIPVTLGNTVAGVLFVGVAFCYAYGKLGKGAKAATA